jgi:hypothetical protein
LKMYEHSYSDAHETGNRLFQPWYIIAMFLR